MREVIETSTYLAATARVGMTDDDRAAVVDFIAVNPQAGDLIKGSGVRKVRVAKPGTGESGSLRLLKAYVSETVAVLLVTAYGERSQHRFAMHVGCIEGEA